MMIFHLNVSLFINAFFQPKFDYHFVNHFSLANSTVVDMFKLKTNKEKEIKMTFHDLQACNKINPNFFIRTMGSIH